MNKSQIFKQAHALAKSVHVAGDCYRVTFSAALKIVSKMAKRYNIAVASKKGAITVLANAFVAKGLGKIWDNDNYNRVYVCDDTLFAMRFNGKAFFDLDLNALVVEDKNTNPVEFFKSIK